MNAKPRLKIISNWQKLYATDKSVYGIRDSVTRGLMGELLFRNLISNENIKKRLVKGTIESKPHAGEGGRDSWYQYDWLLLSDEPSRLSFSNNPMLFLDIDGIGFGAFYEKDMVSAIIEIKSTSGLLGGKKGLEYYINTHMEIISFGRKWIIVAFAETDNIRQEWDNIKEKYPEGNLFILSRVSTLSKQAEEMDKAMNAVEEFLGKL